MKVFLIYIVIFIHNAWTWLYDWWEWICCWTYNDDVTDPSYYQNTDIEYNDDNNVNIHSHINTIAELPEEDSYDGNINTITMTGDDESDGEPTSVYEEDSATTTTADIDADVEIDTRRPSIPVQPRRIAYRLNGKVIYSTGTKVWESFSNHRRSLNDPIIERDQARASPMT